MVTAMKPGRRKTAINLQVSSNFSELKISIKPYVVTGELCTLDRKTLPIRPDKRNSWILNEIRYKYNGEI